jgi:glycosyltransferase involved in cell wall biosynthesis
MSAEFNKIDIEDAFDDYMRRTASHVKREEVQYRESRRVWFAAFGRFFHYIALEITKLAEVWWKRASSQNIRKIRFPVEEIQAVPMHEMSSLTIAYVTARKDCKWEWFFSSLINQILESDDIRVIVVDSYEGTRAGLTRTNGSLPIQAQQFFGLDKLLHVRPKPNVWQGEHRLTKENWFAMANARNTALCLCETDYIAYCDDLSVLLPGWLNAVKEAMAGGYIACGAYRKVKNLVVENGEVKSFTPFSEDCRLASAKDEVSPCTGDWLYGCSCAMPVEDLLEVGGWPEMCDGLGSEDTTLGIVLGNAGKHLKYDKRMMTYEDEDLHHYTVGSDSTWENGLRVSASLKRRDKGVSPNDKSHAIVNIARGSKYFENYYEGGMRALREHVLAGNPFPICQIPDRDWYDGQLISEMT